MKVTRSVACLSVVALTIVGLTACTRAQPPAAAEIETALENQLPSQGIPCDLLDYSDIHVNRTSAPSDDVSEVNLDMDVKVVAEFTPDCVQFMSEGDSDGAWKTERAVQKIVSAYGERDSMAYEWQLSDYDLRLTRDNDDNWQVAPPAAD